MSVKIQILDYVKGNSSNQVSFDTGTTATGWSVSQTSNQIADWDGSIASSGTTYFENVSLPLIVGHEYIITLTITNYSGTGDIGISSVNSSGIANGVGISLRSASNTTITQTITCTAEGSIKTFGLNTNSGTIQVSVIDTAGIDWDKSIVGELDVTDHSEFPLAMTFQISDIKDITATSGDYSKTFKIPATKNNNNLLKHLYTPNSSNTNSATENKSCRILVNDLYSLVGLIKVTGVGGYGEKASFYNCVFYGNNLGWAVSLDNLLMSDIVWGSEGSNLVYQKDEIVATWSDEHCDSSTSPIVYPITSYGDFNFSIQTPYIQLLDTLGQKNSSLDPAVYKGYVGYYNDGNSYGTPSPSPDWRPAVFVKTTLDKIFKNVGYTINSTFMDTDMFKKLVWLLPNFRYNNPDDRYDDYSVDTNFVNNNELTSASNAYNTAIVEDGVTQLFRVNLNENDGDTYYTGTGRVLLNLSDSGSDENLQVNLGLTNSLLNLTDDEITIGEYGYYDLRLSGLQVKVARIFKGGSSPRVIYSLGTTINVEVLTVGQDETQQSAWSIIGQLDKQLNPLNANGGNNVTTQTTSQTEYFDLGELNIQGQYLNAGDKIRLTKGFKIDAETASQNFSVDVFWKSLPSSQFDIAFAPNYVEYGQTYNLNDVTNKEYKQTDFIKGVAHAFNLKMSTNETNKTINIEPYNDFYEPYGSAIDWTYKLDRSKETNDKWLKTDLKNNFVFKYKTDDNDASIQYRAFEYFKGIEDEYPYQEDLGSNFERGESIFENPFFAGTFNAKDQDTTGTGTTDNPFSACLWKEKEDGTLTSSNDISRPPKGFEFLPRLLYWNKYSPSGTLTVGTKYALVQNWALSDYLFVAANANVDTSGGSILSTIYPQATSINRDKTTSPILSYGNVFVRDYNDSTRQYTSYSAGKGLYETYYKSMFEQLKQNPRVRTTYIDLKINDIINLDFKKLIYIDGVYWRINKINDYMPNKNQSTKVELIEWIETGSFAAQAPAFGSSGGSTGGGLGWGNSPIDGGIDNNQNIGV